MPEARDRIVRGAAMRELGVVGQRMRRSCYQDRLRQALARELAEEQGDLRGFFHVETPAAPAASRAWVGMALTEAEGAENTPPASALRQGRGRGSPLPSWYPRTPLRDITALVNAMERRRASLRSAARQRRNERNELTPPSALAARPLPQQFPASHKDPTTTPGPITDIESVQAMESSPRTPCFPARAVPDDKELAERESRLEKSINFIEKAVRENLKKKPEVGAKETTKQRTTLMSMR